jgi:glycine cleavage system H lipoate-binding protein
MYNHSIFSGEENAIIDDIIRNERFDLLTVAIIINSPEQEIEIAKIKKEFCKPVLPTEELKTHTELNKELSKNPQLLNDPEVEKEWQAKIDVEKKALEEKVSGKTEIKEETKAEEIKIEEPVAEVKVKKSYYKKTNK